MNGTSIDNIATLFKMGINVPDPPEINKTKFLTPWYLSVGFIAFLCALWSFYGIPLIAGIVLTIIRYNRKRKFLDSLDEFSFELNETRYNTINACVKLIADSEERKNNNEAIIVNSTMEFEQLKEKVEKEIETLTESKKLKKKEIKELSEQIKALESESFTLNVTPFVFEDDITSEEYKNKLSVVKINYNAILSSENSGLIVHLPYTSDKKTLNNNMKQLIRCFNAECNNIISSVTVKNVDTARNKIQRTFETLNNIFKTDGIQLSIEMIENKLEELNLNYAYKLQKEREKEEQQAIKAQMIEEEKVRREIEKEKIKIEKEEKQFNAEISKLMKYLQKSSDIEKQLYIDKIKELEEKLKLLEKNKENVLEREQNTRAGFVYVISNIGSFGENIYKIGMTRRLEPMDRIKELSSASVPFDFDVHAMIFSDDAPTLENILHKTFEDYAVNKVNKRKEFFKVSLQEIEDVVTKNHNATVIFTKIAKAEQYRETLKIAENLAI